MEALLTWLEGSPLGYAIRHSSVWLYGSINLAHILGVATLFGSILVMDLRLMGVAPRIPIGPLSRVIMPTTVLGFLTAASAGICMLATNGTDYVGNPFLPIKFSAIGIGLLNAAVLNALPAWKRRSEEPLPAHAKRQFAIFGAVSLVSWLTAISCGRLIAYW